MNYIRRYILDSQICHGNRTPARTDCKVALGHVDVEDRLVITDRSDDYILLLDTAIESIAYKYRVDDDDVICDIKSMGGVTLMYRLERLTAKIGMADGFYSKRLIEMLPETYEQCEAKYTIESASYDNNAGTDEPSL